MTLFLLVSWVALIAVSYKGAEFLLEKTGNL